MTPEAERYWRQFWTDPAFRGRPYGYRDPIYTKGYHRGTDLRYQGLALNVPLLRGGVIVSVGNSGAIGRFVAVKPYRPGDYGFVENEFDIYCHLSGAFLPQVSTLTERKAGDILFRFARADEQPGTAWTGPHLHFVVANHPDGGWNTQRADRDPGPIIDSVFSGLAGGGGTPFDPVEDDMYDEAAEARLMAALDHKLDEVKRIAAPFRVFAWGTGHLCVNPRNGRFWILPQGYGELLAHLGYRGGAVAALDDAQLGFVTGFFPSAVGDVAVANTEDGLGAADLEAIKNAIAENRVTLTPDQMETLVAAVGEGARSALEGVTFVASSTNA